MRHFKFLIVVLLLGCNRSSLQLPAYSDSSIKKICKINNVDFVSIVISQGEGENFERTKIECRNLTGSELKNIKLLISVTPEIDLNHNSVQRSIVTIGALDDSNAYTYYLPFRIKDSVSKFIDAGILSIDGKSELLSGLYSGYFVTSIHSDSKIIGSPGMLSGFVLADGTARFYVSKNIFHQPCNISGQFMDSSYFLNGWLTSGESSPSYLLSLDTLISSSDKMKITDKSVLFRLKLSDTLPDGTASLLFNLTK